MIDVPELGPHDALVMVMAAGVNFNNVWAARGMPVDVTKTQARWGEPTDFHIVGSDASGVVYAVGADVTNVKVGDRVVVHAGQWDPDDPRSLAGQRPRARAIRSASGATTRAGARSRSSPRCRRISACPKAEHLTWEEAAAPTLTGATAYRMLFGWPPNTVQPGDVVLVWGGSGGLGLARRSSSSMNAGGRAVAVVCSDEKGEYCEDARRGRLRQPQGVLALGRPAGVGLARVEGVVRRREGVRQGDLGRAGGDGRARRSCSSIPAQDTIPTSNFVCDRGGMIVICAGTTGYDTMVDVRYLWYMQKRYQGSHLFNDEQAAAFNDLVIDGQGPTTLGQTYAYDEVGHVAPADGRRQAPRGQRGGAGQRARARA